MRQYQLRYKQGNHPVETAIVEAGTLERARELAKGYCERMQYKFLSVADPVVAREDEELPMQRPEPLPTPGMAKRVQ
jgi:hypothetical protein